MLLTGEEGGEEIGNSINQVQFYNKAVPSNTVISFCWEVGTLRSCGSPLLPDALMPSLATVVGTVGIQGHEPGGLQKRVFKKRYMY